MMESLRRRAPSSHRSGPASKLVTRRLRAGTAAVLPLALLVLALTGASAASAQSSPQAGSAAQANSPAPVVSSLTTEDMTNPLGIDSSQLLLGWVITSAARKVSQSKYDALAAKPGWTQAGNDDTGWVNAAARPAPTGVLRAQLIPPVEETATIKPVKVTEPIPDTKVYDFGVSPVYTTSAHDPFDHRGRGAHGTGHVG